MAMGLPARAFYSMMRLVPSGIRMRMWRGLYQRMARSQTDPSFRFMNYGFTDDSELELIAVSYTHLTLPTKRIV